MREFLKKCFKYTAASTYNNMGKVSHTRISSYYILASILLLGLTFSGIEIVNAIMVWKEGGGKTYVIPSAHIVIFGMILSHHLVLLGLKKETQPTTATNVTQQNTDTKVEAEVVSQETTKTEESTSGEA